MPAARRAPPFSYAAGHGVEPNQAMTTDAGDASPMGYDDGTAAVPAVRRLPILAHAEDYDAAQTTPTVFLAFMTHRRATPSLL